jgi:hypothetical protein
VFLDHGGTGYCYCGVLDVVYDNLQKYAPACMRPPYGVKIVGRLIKRHHGASKPRSPNRLRSCCTYQTYGLQRAKDGVEVSQKVRILHVRFQEMNWKL